MSILTPFAAALVATATPAAVPPATPPASQIGDLPDPGPDAEELELWREHHERYGVAVTIGGKGPFRFLVDTGAQATVVSHELAQRIDFGERRPGVLVAMASRRPVETVFIDRFGVGAQETTVQNAPILERRNLGYADGILGLDVLQGRRVLMDFEQGRMAVEDAAREGERNDKRDGFEIVVRARQRLGQLIITEAMIDGIRTSVIVDTGAQHSVGNRALERRLRARSMGAIEVEDVNGVALPLDVRMADELRIGRMRLTRLPLGFGEAEPFAALGLEHRPALILGMRELAVFRRVAIDFSSGRVLFDLPRGTS